MKRFLLLLVLLASLVRPLLAQRGPGAPPAAVPVQVACDRADWLYAPGEPVKFTVKVVAGNAALAGAKVTCSIGPEMMPAEKKTVTAALDPQVTALVAAFPAYCDVSGYVHGRAGGWPGMRFLADASEPARETKLATIGSCDAVNFARRLKVPGRYGWGYNDETCPSTSTFSAYNVITAPKSLSIFKGMGHPRVPDLTDAEREWLTNVGLPK
ncbi:MAG: acetylxylan esterase [Verrucomicrobia bacterium]|nr:acetylxylan esterase [Verrucomicrobiota bacterium]